VAASASNYEDCLVNNGSDKSARPSHWLLLAASVLSGWNIFVLVCVFSLAGMAALLTSVGFAVEPRSAAFYMIFTLAGAVSIAVGFLTAKKMYKILKSKTTKYCHISLFFILIITILLFPRIIHYTVY